MDRELEKLRDVYVAAANKADLTGDYRAGFTLLAAGVVTLLGKWQAEQDQRDTWSNRQEAIQYSRDAAAAVGRGYE